MEFLVFRSADRALVVLPALFQPPLACRRQGDIRLVGRCDVELDDIDPAIAGALARDGYARLDDAGWRAFRHRCTSPPEFEDG